jgi:uncharacterized protein YdhG (YjbR/CyaY superfamily)
VARAKFSAIDEYIAAVPEPSGAILQRIRKIVKLAVPDAKETISYGMPAFKVDRVFIYFAAFKNHIGVYPPVAGDAKLLRALEPYRGPKGNLQFPLDQPMPYDVIARVVDALAQQYAWKDA